MKSLLLCTGVLLAASASLLAQPAKVPASPAATATGVIAGKTITVTYNSPRVKGREGHIFTKDGLISHDPHYPVWRAGANAATTLKTEGPLMIGDLHVPAGTYTLFVDIADPDHWTLVISKKTGEWGLAYDPAEDLGRVKLTMSKPSALVEELKYTVESTGARAGKLTLAWENHVASVDIMAH